jgi:hypothetical protein
MKHPEEEFEQTFIYKFTWWITSVWRENKTHLTLSKMSLKYYWFYFWNNLNYIGSIFGII